MNTEMSMIGDAVARMLEGRAAVDGFDAGAWATLEEAGVPRLLRPEAEGGAGDAFRDAAAVLQAWGAHAAAVPLADTLVAHALLARAGIDAPAGPVALVVAGPDGSPDPGADAPASSPAHRLAIAAWGHEVQGEWQPVDGAPRPFSLDDADRVRALLALAAAAVLTGAMRRAIDLSIEWAGVRRQFGRPIGAFQAVQHSLALAAEEVAASRAALDWAAAELEGGRALPAAAVAKARASEAAGRVAAVAHQVHGAIGFTAEHALHRSTRLLWLWRDRWGDEAHWYALLGRQALAAGPDGLFDLVLGEPAGR
jgi:acyl-CoA dehydrogenase